MKNGFRLDPRTKLLLLIVVNTLCFSGTSLAVVLLCGGLTGILLLSSRNWSAVLLYLLGFGLSLFAYLGLPHLWYGGAAALIMTIGFWTARFSITLGLFAYVLLSTGVSEFVAGLSALRVPRVITIPFAVVVRFIPTVLAELSAIIDAMRLRGVVGHIGANPVRASEYVLVPLLSSSTRIADDLSASALIRGLGRPGKPTSVVSLSLGTTDVLIWAVLSTLVLIYFEVWRVW